MLLSMDSELDTDWPVMPVSDKILTVSTARLKMDVETPIRESSR